jgi:hypothetical protein
VPAHESPIDRGYRGDLSGLPHSRLAAWCDEQASLTAAQPVPAWDDEQVPGREFDGLSLARSNQEPCVSDATASYASRPSPRRCYRNPAWRSDLGDGMRRDDNDRARRGREHLVGDAAE